MLGTKEHYEVLDQFEKNFSYMRLDRETDEELKRQGYIYQCGETNNLYKAYIMGYSFGKVQERFEHND